MARPIAGGLALAFLTAAPLAVAAALIAQALLGMWWLGLIVLVVWVVSVAGLGLLARRKGLGSEETLEALGKGFGAHSGGWPTKRR